MANEADGITPIDIDMIILEALMNDRYVRLKNVLWSNGIVYGAFVGSLRAAIENKLCGDLVQLITDIRKKVSEGSKQE